MGTLEKMDAFFNARALSYDDHMLKDLGLDEFYVETSKQFAGLKDRDRLLDLGCGTGLELERLFQQCPGLHVTGIDVSDAMLSVLKSKYPGKNLHLICGNYFDTAFGDEAYGFALSTYSLHHFPHKQKQALYQKVCKALVPGGIFVIGDYTVKTKEEEDFHLVQSLRLTGEAGLADGSCHYDTPFTAETEMELLSGAGFSHVRIIKQWERTVLIAAGK
jgi:tRNA (cmo5U34)-methyltransferase